MRSTLLASAFAVGVFGLLPQGANAQSFPITPHKDILTTGQVISSHLVNGERQSDQKWILLIRYGGALWNCEVLGTLAGNSGKCRQVSIYP